MAGLGEIPLDEVVYFDVTTHNVTTGAISDADSTPTFDVFEEATDTPIVSATNFTKRTSLTGNYRGTFTCSAANGFELGKWYNVIASATVNSVAAKAVALTFRIIPAESSAGVQNVDVTHIGGSAVSTSSAQIGVNVVSYASGQTPLQPTVSGRTLDVSAGGEAGVDWANVGSATTTVNLSGTTISTSQAVASVSGAVGSVTGAVGSVTGNVGGNVTGSVASVVGAVGSVTGNVGGNVTGSIGSLGAQAKLDVNAEADTALSDVGVTTTITGRIDAAISTRLATAGYTAPLDAAGTRTAVGLASANLDTQISSLATASALSTVSTNVSTAVTQTTASSLRAAVGLASANLDTQLGDLPTAVENADALLGRNVAGGSSSGRLVKEALYFLRNKWTVSGGTLTVYATDDTTSAWTSTVSTDDTAEPVTGSDPS